MPFAVCVFCGSAFGARPEYVEAARSVGQEIGRRGWTLVYGGGRVGLMGTLADAALGFGARVIGVIPQFLHAREVAHTGLAQLEVVPSFAARKARMGELSDVFLSLPGGVGTLDELFEAWSWTQARLQDKPSGLLNVGGYYDPLIEFIDRAVQEGFLKPESRSILHVGRDIPELLSALAARTSSPAAGGKVSG
jgi:uncharacterized protein (TIGR00730 family)